MNGFDPSERKQHMAAIEQVFDNALRGIGFPGAGLGNDTDMIFERFRRDDAHAALAFLMRQRAWEQMAQ